MARPVNHQRRDDLLDAAVSYAIEFGFAELSWRPVAAALNVSPTTLVHYFGTKEQMLEAILERLRQRVIADIDARVGEQPDFITAARGSWARSTDPTLGPEFRLLFAVYGRALQAPDQFSDFLDHVVADWKELLVATQGSQLDSKVAERNATLVIATIRGLLLDLLTTGDQARVEDAAESFFAVLADSYQAVPGATA